MKKLLYLLLIPFGLSAQVGSWYDFLSYKNASHVAQIGDNYFCSAENGLIIYNRADGSLSTLSRINGLSDARISTMTTDETRANLLIGYENGNLDIVTEKAIINIPDILNSGLFGKKSINDILIHEDKAFIGCGFGIVFFDLKKFEIKETYFIGQNAAQVNVLSLAKTESKIYAATEKGIYSADLNNPNLIDFNSWTLEPIKANKSFNAICTINNQVFVNQNNTNFNADTMYVFRNNNWSRFGDFSWSTRRLRALNNQVFACHAFSVTQYDTLANTIRINNDQFIPDVAPSDILIDQYGHYWIADINQGLIHNWFGVNVVVFAPSSPANSGAYDIEAHNNKILISTGSIDHTWANTFSAKGAHYFNGDSWTFISPDELNDARDLISAHLSEKTGKLYLGSWRDGAFEIQPNGSITQYNTNNSSLQDRANDNLGYIRVGGIDEDEEGRIWLSNSEVNQPISVIKPNGDWQSYSLSPHVTADQLLREIHADVYNNKWVFLRRDGLVVFNDNGTVNNTSDDKVMHLSTQLGKGNLPSDEVLSIAEDLDGEIWVGTALGVAVFYNPELLFDPSGEFVDAQPVLIQIDGTVTKLLDEERVTAIAIDGANRKWFGTNSGGLFLFSADGTRQLAHFTKENSPLLSNTIVDVEIDQVTGFVYVATDKGMLAYLGEAIEPREDLSNVYAFPNPVRPDYEGPIAITGLVRDSNVKITDISGNLVYETNSNGGRATWDGRTLDGQRARTGVYLIFIANEDGSQTLVSKVAFVR